MSARDTILLALTRYYQTNTDPRGTAMQVIDGYDAARRTELLSERADVRDRMLGDAHAAGHAEALTMVTAWLVKKAREFHASSRKREREQGDTCAVLASKIARGAVHPDNLRMLPNAGFFEVDRTYEREHHGAAITFKVTAISASPDGRTTVAHGWRLGPDFGWEPTDSDDLTGWTDVTEAGDAG